MGDPTSHDALTAPNHASAAGAAMDLVRVCRSATLPRAEYRLYRALLLAFPQRGGPPDHAMLRQLARRYGVGLRATLAQLTRQDLVQRDPASDAITAAYPFSGVPTAHRVTLVTDQDGSSVAQVYAMCALDALGIPLMLRRPARITSVDPLTGEAVRVGVWQVDTATEYPARGAESGLTGWRAAWDPVTAVLYARPEDDTTEACDVDACAPATVCRCPVTNFFTAPAHARRWAEQHGAPSDVLLAPAEALQRAQQRFGRLLDRLDGSVGLVAAAD